MGSCGWRRFARLEDDPRGVVGGEVWGVGVCGGQGLGGGRGLGSRGLGFGVGFGGGGRGIVAGGRLLRGIVGGGWVDGACFGACSGFAKVGVP